jgi:hypothetical protein
MGVSALESAEAGRFCSPVAGWNMSIFGGEEWLIMVDNQWLMVFNGWLMDLNRANG